MDQTILQLIEHARPLLGEITLGRHDLSAATVACAIQSVSGRIYTGVCLHLSCGIGFCAEHAAVADMVKHRETQIALIVAVCSDGILPPCGRCRELLVQINPKNLDAQVVLPGPKALPLRDLLPHHWMHNPNP
jgi:cytidine deaminase